MATPPVPVITKTLVHAKRKVVFDSLFALLQTIPGPLGSTWKTSSQRLKIWDEVSAANQPAIFLHRGLQRATQTKAFGVSKWELRATVWIYFRTENLKTESHYPDEFTDELIDNIELTLQTDPLAGPLNFDETIYHAWIDGSIFIDSGIEDNQAVVVVPITILF